MVRVPVTDTQVAAVAQEYGLTGAHGGSSGSQVGVWGRDAAGRITFVAVARAR